MEKENDIALIYILYADDLFSYGCNLGFEKETVEDAMQDVFVKIITNSNKQENICNIKLYLLRSLKNRLLDIHKNKKEYVEPESIPQNTINIQVNAEELMIEEEEQQQIKTRILQMLNSLTDRQRKIIYLRYIQGYDYRQTAELLQISVHGCRKLVSKALLSLREKYAIPFLWGCILFSSCF